MADKESVSVDIESITCHICHELFQNPVFIKCYHTFCRKCLKQLKQKMGIITCPLCEDMDERDISSLSRNLYAEARILFQNTEDTRACEICEKTQNVNWKCIECDQMLCNDCNKVHSKLKLSRDHEVIVYNQENCKARIMKERHCQKHENEILRFMCNTCKIPICRDCKITAHEGHKTVDISSVVDEARTWAKEKTAVIEEEIKSLKRSIESFNCYKQITDLQTRQLCKSVDKLEEQLHHEISKECAELKEKLATDRQSILKNISDKKSKLMWAIHRFSTKEKYIDNIFSIGADVDLMQCKNDMQAEQIQKGSNITCNRMRIEIISQVTTAPVRIQDMFKLERYNHDGFFLSLKYSFVCEELAGKVITSIFAGSDGVLIAFSNTNFLCNFLLRKTVFSYSKEGQLMKVHPIPPQLDITVDKIGNILWYSENQWRLFWYPLSHTDNDENKPVAETVNRPIAVDISEKGNIVHLDNKKTIYKNFNKVNGNSCMCTLTAPISLCCVNDAIWITDPGKGQVTIYSSEGRVQGCVSEEDIPLQLGEKFNPHGICYNPNVKLIFVSDSRNNFVLAVDSARRYSFVLLTEEQGLFSPTCLATRDRELWVCDRNKRVSYYEI